MLIDSYDLHGLRKIECCFAASSISNFQQQRNLSDHKKTAQMGFWSMPGITSDSPQPHAKWRTAWVYVFARCRGQHQNKIISSFMSFQHPHVIPNMYSFLSFVIHNRIYSEKKYVYYIMKVAHNESWQTPKLYWNLLILILWTKTGRNLPI